MSWELSFEYGQCPTVAYLALVRTEGTSTYKGAVLKGNDTLVGVEWDYDRKIRYVPTMPMYGVSLHGLGPPPNIISPAPGIETAGHSKQVNLRRAVLDRVKSPSLGCWLHMELDLLR
ncbi:unnamed protein product [Pleuronectes platessa]|uniref:Uncharacterized protein n=1 Tax=Pleuronectes platessa TaxID=8262 RepID=A0A9N7W0Y3_PLEPL|nr:unnamed protein product [Pleuronectes platessa]